jgi:hypothetical protein
LAASTGWILPVGNASAFSIDTLASYIYHPDYTFAGYDMFQPEISASYGWRSSLFGVTWQNRIASGAQILFMDPSKTGSMGHITSDYTLTNTSTLLLGKDALFSFKLAAGYEAQIAAATSPTVNESTGPEITGELKYFRLLKGKMPVNWYVAVDTTVKNTIGTDFRYMQNSFSFGATSMRPPPLVFGTNSPGDCMPLKNSVIR